MKKIKFIFRYLFSIIVFFLKLTKFQNTKNKKIISIINFHYFLDNNQIPQDSSLEINIDIFDNQLRILKESKIKFINGKKDLNNFFKNEKISKERNTKFLITIDDADYNIKKIVPIIEKYKIPFILFAPIGFCINEKDIIGLRCRYLHNLYFKLSKNLAKKNFKELLLSNFHEVLKFDYNKLKLSYENIVYNYNDSFFNKKKFLSIKDLAELSKNPLITVASHSMTHLPLSELPSEWLNWEIKESKKYINKLKGDDTLFSYPYGYHKSYNQEVKNILNNLNFEYAFTTRATLVEKNYKKFEMGRTFLFNSKNKYYILSTAFGSMKLFDSILRR